eukprot:692624-Alexandrium_andersonii.AAC.1
MGCTIGCVAIVGWATWPGAGGSSGSGALGIGAGAPGGGGVRSCGACICMRTAWPGVCCVAGGAGACGT